MVTRTNLILNIPLTGGVVKYIHALIATGSYKVYLTHIIYINLFPLTNLCKNISGKNLCKEVVV